MKLTNLISKSPIPKHQAEIFLSQLLKKDKSFIFAHPEYQITPKRLSIYENYLARSLKHEPLSYILGYKEFYGLKFLVDKRVMIPRPETEELVEKVLRMVNSNRSKSTEPFIIADIGTGSGCVAIAIAKNLQEKLELKIYATDISEDALEVAKLNAKLHQVQDKIEFLHGDLLLPFRSLSPANHHLDLIVANLPYIPTARTNSLAPEIRDWEPKIALDGGSDGLKLYKQLFNQSAPFLKPGGLVLYELDGHVLDIRS